MSNSTSASVIIDALRQQANDILSSATGSVPLESFNTNALGNFPYYYEDPNNLVFNAKTYNWIDASLKANTHPVQLGQPFTNQFIKALSAISYSLSTDDQERLNQADANAVDQKTAVLTAWRSAFGTFPAGDGQPLDNIVSEITTKWANPPTTLMDIQESINLNQTLNNTPASGQSVVPVFVNYLNALSSVLSLKNAVTMNTGYLSAALRAAQFSAENNGGMLLNDSTTQYHPAYQVATSLSSIQNSLKNENQAVKLSMTVDRSSQNEFQVKVSGGASASFPVLGFLSVNVGGNASYFQSDVATSQNETTVELSFPGVTLVQYGPVAYDQATRKNWYWTQPIQDAIQNRNKDVSGFQFHPDPNIDFSSNGPFSFTQGAAISNYPTVKITVKSADYQRIQKTFEQSASTGISFLGIPLGIGGKESSYSNSVQVDQSNSTVTITLEPPKELVAGAATDSVGWVLGVQTVYPLAGLED
ncbi:lamin tail domain-containing protein [Thalassotalea marina]|uniref:Uncharacterized protein n=1 Tax=Thalassotalea marina TaxID=1673741 RepID=A0A919ELM4_9GAMM|nr:lamin tail domain-containing protein [Thalassotalea marina]GHF95300.1 hypothetical protein GCM10017161_24520 [Thalassotalea marina]